MSALTQRLWLWMVSLIMKALLVFNGLLGLLLALVLTRAVGIDWPVALLAGWVLLPVIHGLALGVGFWISDRYSRAVPRPVGGSLTVRGGLLRAWLREIPIAWYTFLVAQAFRGNEPLPSGTATDKMPVLLIHGHFCNQALWRPFSRWLAKRGHPVASINLEPLFGDIDKHAPAVARAVASLCESSGAAKVALVGHSMGGLVIRAYLRAFAQAPVSHAVTLGSPHRGTFWARFSGAVNVRQMRLDSPWLLALANHERQAGTIPFTNILSEHDNVVAPAGRQAMSGAKVDIWRGLGHLDLAYEVGVWRQVACAIDNQVQDGAGSTEPFATIEPLNAKPNPGV